MRTQTQHACIAAILIALAGCSPPPVSDTSAPARSGAPISSPPPQPPAGQADTDADDFFFETADAKPMPAMLSEFGAFQDMARQIPAANVIPYGLNTEHFADYAHVRRFVRVPQDAQIHYSTDGVPTFPVGTLLLQTFSYPAYPPDPALPERLIETRVMRRLETGWDGVAYSWNKEGTDARRALAGGIVPVTWVDPAGQEQSFRYIVPNANDCKRCHENQGAMLVIGLVLGNVNLDYAYADGSRNQIEHWLQRGILTGAPGMPDDLPRLVRWNDSTDGTVEHRARAWLQVNCAHCHNPAGAAGVSGLDLRLTEASPIRLGVYKPPVAAGRGSEGHRYSIEPGNPQASFLVGRLTSCDPAVMMPPVGRRLSNAEAVELVSEWIAGMHFSESDAQKLIAKQREIFERLKREGEWIE
ncbi:MAG: hypothetical protein HYV27_22650 [Candidatus Hydrogenedentes bacterium]|nr:hypothetical protein [Candidatus Hydrogenedentota bacterium]